MRMENQEDLQESYLKVLEKVELGSSVSGVVINVMKDYVLVDIGYKSEGFIKIDEFETIPKIGDEIDAIVTKVGGELGLGLSVSKLDSINLQDKIDEYIANKKVLKGKILVELSSGYKVQVNENITGFMPSYLSSMSKDEKLKRGSIVEFYVVQSDKTDNNLRLILDRRTLERERELLKKREIVSSYSEGDIVDGIVERITSYGAIIKVKNLVLGILHKRNIAFNRVDNVEDFIHVGDKLRLKIIKLSVNTGKMELSLKALKTNPWDSVESRYKLESIVKGKVAKILPFGVVVELDSEISGFLHISNFSWVRVIKSPQELVKVGQIVEVKILDIDKDNQRISLGIKQINENPWHSLAERCAVGKVVQGVVKNITKTGAFVSIEEGIDAYISKFDISWLDEINPEEYFKLGSLISGKVIEFDAKKQNIRLGIKQLEENPWDDFSKSYKKGDTLEVEIVEKKSKGIQVRVYGKIMGFISKIQLGVTKESSLETFENLNVGDKLKVIITNIDFKNKLVLLSYRAYKEQKSSEEISSYLFKEDDEESYKPFANLLKRNADV
ncbi:SSU ribosomal protein S1P (plasmid) [Borrelia anserina BA2]|uniref:SSU ribosomal protein S1P n=3 Tax=Borrelia anserina TaxID=143 RepID=W5SMH9_BORAN|nr:SSU ribosomal protein S1P [Borrelia anserina BA2]AHH08903.1 SSU ribosomal protein S1P [Borrelia anserina BA2]AHX39227.1 ribosomal protein [Borrelia anserina Es]